MQPVFNPDPEYKKNIVRYMRNLIRFLCEKQTKMPEGYGIEFDAGEKTEIDRCFTALEAALVFAGCLTAGKNFDLKDVEVVDVYSWYSLFVHRKIKRKEKYREFIWRLANEFIEQNTQYDYIPGKDINEGYAKMNPQNCAVIVRDGDGKSAGPCCYFLKDKTTCPTHRVVKQIKED
jgi:hypothetical protein